MLMMNGSNFLTEVDMQLVRMGSEITLLSKVVETQKEELAKAKAEAMRVPGLEAQVEKLVEQIRAHEFYAQKEKETLNGQTSLLRELETEAKPNDTERVRNGKGSGLRGGTQSIS